MAANNSGTALSESDRIFNDSKEMVDLLVSLGADINTAKTLMCLHVHGPSKSSELQSKCDLRQPDVSISINKLKKMVDELRSAVSKGSSQHAQLKPCFAGSTCIWFKQGTCPNAEWHRVQGHGSSHESGPASREPKQTESSPAAREEGPAK